MPIAQLAKLNSRLSVHTVQMKYIQLHMKLVVIEQAYIPTYILDWIPIQGVLAEYRSSAPNSAVKCQ
jgi:hypothetical protein